MARGSDREGGRQLPFHYHAGLFRKLLGQWGERVKREKGAAVVVVGVAKRYKLKPNRSCGGLQPLRLKWGNPK